MDQVVKKGLSIEEAIEFIEKVPYKDQFKENRKFKGFARIDEITRHRAGGKGVSFTAEHDEIWIYPDGISFKTCLENATVDDLTYLGKCGISIDAEFEGFHTFV